MTSSLHSDMIENLKQNKGGDSDEISDDAMVEDVYDEPISDDNISDDAKDVTQGKNKKQPQAQKKATN